MTIMLLLLTAVSVLFVLEVFVGGGPGLYIASVQPGLEARLSPWEFLSWPAPLLLTTTGLLLLMAHPTQGLAVLGLAGALSLAGRLGRERKGRDKEDSMQTDIADTCISYRAVGVLRSPFTDVKGMPIQPTGATGVPGCIEVFLEFKEGLKDLEGFSHVILLYHLHKIRGHDLLVKPFLDTEHHGIFATRSPKRPNPIGLSVLRLAGVEGCLVRLENVDILDGTPVIDIKPYVTDFDVWPADRCGWFDGKSCNATHCKSDGRFECSESSAKAE